MLAIPRANRLQADSYKGIGGHRPPLQAWLLVPDWSAQQEKLEEARQAWQLVVDAKLPFAALAQAKLARFNPPGAKP